MTRHVDFEYVERKYGIVLPEVEGYIDPVLAQDFRMAMDAQPALVTVSNSGIPAFLTNFVDPKFIEVLTSPNKAAQILGEVKKGDWVTEVAFFPFIESAGETSGYGDYNTNGEITANANWPQRQSYHYQTITQWGERELDRMAQGKIDWASRLNISSAKVMDKFQNKSYFYGIANLQNYGLLNDPSLSAALTPSTKAAGGTTWVAGTAQEIFGDIESLFTQVITQSNDTIERDAKCRLCMSPASAMQLTKLNTLTASVSVYDMIAKAFPGMKVETAVEYVSTGAGNLVQLIIEEVDGQETGTTAFTEKMRAHAVERKTSSFLQKKSGGTWGSIIFQPFAISQMLGV